MNEGMCGVRTGATGPVELPVGCQGGRGGESSRLEPESCSLRLRGR